MRWWKNISSVTNEQSVSVLTAELLCRKRENLPVRRQYGLFFCPRAENKRRGELIRGLSDPSRISDRKSGVNNYPVNCVLRYLLLRRLHILFLSPHLGFLRHGRVTVRAHRHTLAHARWVTALLKRTTKPTHSAGKSPQICETWTW